MVLDSENVNAKTINISNTDSNISPRANNNLSSKDRSLWTKRTSKKNGIQPSTLCDCGKGDQTPNHFL